jgi:hypothetical protein
LLHCDDRLSFSKCENWQNVRITAYKAARVQGSFVENNLKEDIRECYRHAEDCALKAAAQTDPKAKQDFLDLEQRWLSLARSFKFAELLTNGFKPAASGPLPGD